ncbi:MAG: site-2 protease family protein [Candidatus Limnocylindrales bacterium]
MPGLNITPATVIAVAVMLLVGFPVHEFSHALVAYRLGDGTAKLFGRLTLNPIVHFDPIGGGILALSALFGGIFIGWAKPTPVNPMQLRGRNGEALVALAGPLSNLVMAIVASIPLRYLAQSTLVGAGFDLLAQVLWIFILINISLAIFNLVPIPPLDGSKVLYAMLDPRTVWQIRPMLEQYGFFIILLFFFTIGGRIFFDVVLGTAHFLVGV